MANIYSVTIFAAGSVAQVQEVLERRYEGNPSVRIRVDDSDPFINVTYAADLWAGNNIRLEVLDGILLSLGPCLEQWRWVDRLEVSQQHLVQIFCEAPSYTL